VNYELKKKPQFRASIQTTV